MHTPGVCVVGELAISFCVVSMHTLGVCFVGVSVISFCAVCMHVPGVCSVRYIHAVLCCLHARAWCMFC
jgi:hypothetical protein